MEDFVEFTVALEDKVSGPSDTINAALQEIIKTLKETQSAMVGLNKKAEAPPIVKPGLLARVSKGLSGIIGQLESAVFWTAKWGLGLVGGAVTGFAGMVTHGVVSMGIFADAARRSFSALTGGEAQGAAAFERVRATAQLLGEDVQQTADQFKGLLAMQFKVGDAEELIKIAADLKAVTGHAEATGRAITAITQIKAKGRLQSEELVGQLAEAGVSTTLVYEQLAQKLGKSQADIRAMISKGAIDANTGIWAIKEAIKHKVHEKNAGEAAVGFSNETLTGLLQRLSNLPNTLYLATAEKLNKEFEDSKGIIRDIIDDLGTIDTDKIAEFMRNVLRTVKTLIPLAKEFAGGFMEAFGIEFDLGSGPEDLAKNLATARDAGKALAKALGLAWDVAKGIAKAFLWLTTDDVGQWVAWLLLGLYTLIKISGWVTAIRTAFGVMGAASGAAAAGGAAGGGGLGFLGWLTAIAGFLISLPGLILAATAAIVGVSWVYREELAKMALAGKDWVVGRPDRYGAQVGRGLDPNDPSRMHDGFEKNTAKVGVDQALLGLGMGPKARAPQQLPVPQPQPALQSALTPPQQNFTSHVEVNMSVADTQGMSAKDIGDHVAAKVDEVNASFYENQNASYGAAMSSQPLQSSP